MHLLWHEVPEHGQELAIAFDALLEPRHDLADGKVHRPRLRLLHVVETLHGVVDLLVCWVGRHWCGIPPGRSGNYPGFPGSSRNGRIYWEADVVLLARTASLWNLIAYRTEDAAGWLR